MMPQISSKWKSEFIKQVDTVFPRVTPFEDSKYAKLSQSLNANLFAGMGFFYGDSKVDRSHAIEYEETDLQFWDKAS